MAKPEKSFDAIAWTRARRDNAYQTYGHLPVDEYLRRVAEEGRNSDFGTALRARFSSTPTPKETSPTAGSMQPADLQQRETA